MKSIKVTLSFLMGVFLFFSLNSCYQPKPVKVIKNIQKLENKILFIALDGIDHELMKEVKSEGYFQGFLEPAPFLSTFPSGTTTAFTGIFQPLDVGRVPGYEIRFYSYEKNDIIGGTPSEVHKIDINYKTYFDYFRHQIFEKSVMYILPGVAGKQDILNIEKLLLNNPKKMLFAYLGGTDGSAHMLGRERTKRFLKYMDGYLQRMILKYEKQHGIKPHVVMFSDHGFHYDNLKFIDLVDFEKKLEKHGFKIADKISNERDIVPVKLGLLSGGVFFTPLTNRAEMANLLASAEGIDLVFWHQNQNVIFIKNSLGEEARFEYRGLKEFRYVPVKGDPLDYVSLLRTAGHKTDDWILAEDWLALTYNHRYPDAAYRVYDAFFNLVENPASIMFSTKENYQYGSKVTLTATYAKFGQKGTHGGLFKEATNGFFMSNIPNSFKSHLRYNQLFPYFIPKITHEYEKIQKENPQNFIYPQFGCCL